MNEYLVWLACHNLTGNAVPLAPVIVSNALCLSFLV